MKTLQQLTRLNVPQSASCIAGAGQNLIVWTWEKAARHIARVGSNSPLLRCNVFLQSQRIDRDLVVESATRHDLRRRTKGTSHDPSCRHCDRVFLVRRERVPDDQFSVLRRRDQVTLVGAPVNTEDLGIVAFKTSTHLAVEALNRFDRFRHLSRQDHLKVFWWPFEDLKAWKREATSVSMTGTSLNNNITLDTGWLNLISPLVSVRKNSHIGQLAWLFFILSVRRCHPINRVRWQCFFLFMLLPFGMTI